MMGCCEHWSTIGFHRMTGILWQVKEWLVSEEELAQWSYWQRFQPLSQRIYIKIWPGIEMRKRVLGHRLLGPFIYLCCQIPLDVHMSRITTCTIILQLQSVFQNLHHCCASIWLVPCIGTANISASWWHILHIMTFLHQASSLRC